MRARHVALAISALAVAGASVAFAASQGLLTDRLGAARATIPRCGTAGLTVFQNLSASNVISVTVGNLPSSCGGAAIQVAVNNGGTSSTGSSTVPAGGGSLTIALAVAVAVATSESTDVVLTGP